LWIFISRWRKNNPEKQKASIKKWKVENIDRVRESCRKRRAKRLDIKEKYSKEDEFYTRMIFENKCANCGSLPAIKRKPTYQKECCFIVYVL
jgi:hypothetical protein